jgi:nucleotide-binding universal stress UspA family protein
VIKHVLVPVDGSELSGKAAAQAVDLARALNAKVTAFHAYPEYHAVLLYEYVGRRRKAISRR